MKEYFHRQIQLWGEQKQDQLKTKKIAIIGSGGLGCSVGIALGSSGIGTIYCVDFDKVEIHNIHRQIAFTPENEGDYKSIVLSKIIKQRSPDIKSIPIADNFETFAKQELELDLIIDATDNLYVRSQIDSYAKNKNIPWIYGSVEEFNGQVCFLDESNFSAFKIKDREPKGITAPMVMHIASLQANLALRYLVNLQIKKDILYYLFFNDIGELITQKFKMSRVNNG